MRRKIHKIEEYREISSEVWMIFKKYFPKDAVWDDFGDDVHKLDEKYRHDVRQYCFMRELIKVYFNELNELRKLRDLDEQKNQNKS